MSTNDDTGYPTLAIILLVFLLIVCAFGFGQRNGIKLIQTEAVKRGHAEWKVNDSGQTTFAWK